MMEERGRYLRVLPHGLGAVVLGMVGFAIQRFVFDAGQVSPKLFVISCIMLGAGCLVLVYGLFGFLFGPRVAGMFGLGDDAQESPVWMPVLIFGVPALIMAGVVWWKASGN